MSSPCPGNLKVSCEKARQAPRSFATGATLPMAEFNNLVFADTDVLINWLAHEKESQTARPLWPAVEKILLAIQNKKLRGATSIITIMEVRAFLRRGTRISKKQVEKEINKINSLLNILVPNDITLLLANQIQIDTSLMPIDSIQLAIVQENSPATLVTRDKELLLAAKGLACSATPEELSAALK